MHRFAFHRDDSTGILRVTTHGCWNEQDGRDFAVAYRQQFDSARASWGVVRVLLDGRDTTGHPREVNRHYRKLLVETLADPADRLAVVACNSLVKLDSRQGLVSANIQAFLSMNAAEIWLRAHQ